VPHLAVVTYNDFPTAAGLASSASGFAALVTAVDGALGLDLDLETLADEARRASASAARSLLGGFVTFDGGDDAASWMPRQLLTAAEWPLEVVVAVCSGGPKAISSSDGMIHSRSTSPYYDRWLEAARHDFLSLTESVRQRDFTRLADTAEANCLAMHATMLAARPALVYWNGATIECMHRIRALREMGIGVFFTIDAGPQLKAVCLPGVRAEVEAALLDVSGVERVIHSGLGGGAHLEPIA